MVVSVSVSHASIFSDSSFAEFDERKHDSETFSEFDEIIGLRADEKNHNVDDCPKNNDDDYETTMRELSRQMELENKRNSGSSDSGSEFSSISVRTQSGRNGQLIVEASDEGETIGLVKYDEGTEEFRRQQSYHVNGILKQIKTQEKGVTKFTKDTHGHWKCEVRKEPQITKAPTFKMDKFGNFVIVPCSETEADKKLTFAPLTSDDIEKGVHGIVRQATGHPKRTRNNGKSNQTRKRKVRFVEDDEDLMNNCAKINRQITQHNKVMGKKLLFHYGKKAAVKQSASERL